MSNWILEYSLMFRLFPTIIHCFVFGIDQRDDLNKNTIQWLIRTFWIMICSIQPTLCKLYEFWIFQSRKMLNFLASWQQQHFEATTPSLLICTVDENQILDSISTRRKVQKGPLYAITIKYASYLTLLKSG